MRRKSFEGTGILPGLEDHAAPAKAPPERGGRAESSRTKFLPQRIWTPKLVVSAVAAGLLLALGLYAFHLIEQFLIDDARFALNGTEGDVDTLAVLGSVHSSERAIEGVFAEDQGRSVYLIPLAERRTSLRAVDWVKDATVARIWPNSLRVRVAERVPVAFIALRGARYGLIDEDGVILSASKDRFHLPVLAGVQATLPIAERKERVRRMLRLTGELGDEARKVSEIDVADRDNLKVSVSESGKVVWLMLGDRHFGLRYRNFLSHFEEIGQKLPGALTFDLRLEDRITAVE